MAVELLEKGARSPDEWEQYIREASAENVIIERGRRWLEFYEHCQRDHIVSGGSRFREFAEQRFGYSQPTTARWVAIGKGADELINIVNKLAPDWGAMEAYLRLPENAKQKLLDSGRRIDRTTVTEFLRLAKAGERATVKYPVGKYRVIYADPPWQYSNAQPEYHTEQADHYPLMSLQEICDLPVRELAPEDAVLFLWVTSPILRESFAVVDAWGFEYKAAFVWDKVKHNMGHYNSVRHELLLICVRGSCPPDEQKLFDSVQSIERGAHSEKPEEFRKIIDTLYPHGPRIELFSRGDVPKPWKRWGNE